MGWQSLTGRGRVLLTNLSWKYPFFSAEVITTFRNNKDVWHALRASCHVPIIGGIGPHIYDGRAYFDGMFWPQMMVQWRGSTDDHLVRVSAFSAPLAQIKPPVLPSWWSVLPPDT